MLYINIVYAEFLHSNDPECRETILAKTSMMTAVAGGDIVTVIGRLAKVLAVDLIDTDSDHFRFLCMTNGIDPAHWYELIPEIGSVGIMKKAEPVKKE